MFSKIFTIGSLGLSLSLLSLPVVANECSSRQVQSASETQEIVNQEYSLQFEIPRNYHTSFKRYDSQLIIEIRNPGDVEFEACMSEPANSGNSRYVATDVTVSIYDLPPNVINSNDLLGWIASQADRNINIEHSLVEKITIDGQEGIFVIEKFSGNRSRYPETNHYAYVLHPDEQHIIHIRAWELGTNDVDALDLEIQRLILSTLSFF